MAQEPEHSNLAAQYSAPHGVKTFRQPLPSLPSGSQSPTVSEKTTQLSALRTGAREMQAAINAFLTEEMDKDKLREGGRGNAGNKKDEQKLEDLYGEEEAAVDT